MASQSASSTPAWELSKENTAPLQRGRNVAALESALVETDETRVFKEKSVERYERLVQPSEKDDYTPTTNDDPLVDWLGYIKFHQDSFPTNTHDQFLLMERCFRALCRFRKYANDVRFIRLCCRYADKTERPTEIFKYLYQQKIGTETALFYIGWGYIAETEGDFSFAKQIYDKGLKKKAKPVKLLNQRSQQFNRRMARRWCDTTKADEDDDESAPNRGVLGSLSEDSFRRNDRSSTRPPGPSFLARTSTVPTRQNNQSSFVDRSAPVRSAASNTFASSAFPIFVEEGGTAASANPLDEPQENVRYRQLELNQERKKENTHAAERWNERGAYEPSYAKARAAPKPRAAVPPPFPVYVDEECVAQQRKEEEQRERQNQVHRRARDDRTFRDRDDLRVGESLLKDPLRYVRNPDQLEADLQTARPPTKEPTVENIRNKRTANCGFSSRLLKNPETGEEQCFAEARAQAKHYKLVDASTNINYLMVAPESSDKMSTGDERSRDDDVSMADDSSSSSSEKRKSFLIPQNVSFGKQSPVNASTASSTLEDEGVNVGLVEPTFHSKMAAQDISLMFCSPGGVKVNDSVSGALNRSGGLGTILNQSGISEPAENRSMAAIEEENGFQIFDENDQNARTGGFEIYEEPAENDSPAQAKPSGLDIYNDAEEKEEEDGKQPAKSPALRAACAIFSEEGGHGEHFDESEQPQEMESNSHPKNGGFYIYSDVADAGKNALSNNGQASGDMSQHEKSSTFPIYADEPGVKEEEFQATSLAIGKNGDNDQEKENTGFSVFIEQMDAHNEAIGENAKDLVSGKHNEDDSQNKSLKLQTHQESDEDDEPCFTLFQDDKVGFIGDGAATADPASIANLFDLPTSPTTAKRPSDVFVSK